MTSASNSKMGPGSQLAAAYRCACQLELEALKPGNVHRYAAGHGMSRADFVNSAEASAGPLTQTGLGIGERIYRAVAATRRAVGCNTNLGIILLTAPLLQAMLEQGSSEGLRQRLRRILSEADARQTNWLFRAINLAAPAGLGQSDRYDVGVTATAPLLEVMGYAAQRDLIARQYASGFVDLFDHALPLLRAYRSRWRDEAWAVAGLFLSLLKTYPDTHIARKQGAAMASAVSEGISELADEFSRSDRPQTFSERLLQLDTEFKRQGINPGTTADLTVATVLILRLESIPGTFEPKAGISRIDDTEPVEAGSKLCLINNNGRRNCYARDR